MNVNTFLVNVTEKPCRLKNRSKPVSKGGGVELYKKEIAGGGGQRRQAFEQKLELRPSTCHTQVFSSSSQASSLADFCEFNPTQGSDRNLATGC